MTTDIEAKEIDVLVAARRAWEALRDEIKTHDREDDTFLCLACHRRAKEFDKAVQALSERLTRLE